MQTTDPPTEPWRPLGERVVKSTPAKPEWKPVPGSPHIEEGPGGKLRTNLPLPPRAPFASIVSESTSC